MVIITNRKEIHLTSPLGPSVNHYLGYRAVMKNGRPFAISYKTNEAVKYCETFKKYVTEQAKLQNWELDQNKHQNFYVDAIFYFDKKGRDCNNHWKVLLDAITDTGLIWLDDDVVCERVQRIYYDSKNPRIELVIYPVDYIGVFDNASQLAEFKETNCIGCKRYNRNCSILQRAKTGKIQDEIDDNVCKSKK